jgi:hypothetical protein
MFIGQYDEINFARGRDKSPRKRRSDAGRKRTGSGMSTAKKVGIAAGTAGALGGAAALAARKRKRGGAMAMGAGGSPQMQMQALRNRANSPMAKAGGVANRVKGAAQGASSAVQGGVAEGQQRLVKARRAAGESIKKKSEKVKNKRIAGGMYEAGRRMASSRNPNLKRK